MLIKFGVYIDKLNRNVRRALPAIENTVVRVTGAEAVITSTYEGNHSLASLHYENKAVDIRLPKKDVINELRNSLRKELGKNFDVVKSNSCIHIEWDPK